MSYNQQEGDQITLIGKNLKQVRDFLYLGSWINSCEKDINVRIAKAIVKMDTVWKSNLKKNIKIEFFKATVETVLLYGCNTWTLTKAKIKKLDGVYTRMLRVAQNVTWRLHLTNRELYGKLPKILH